MASVTKEAIDMEHDHISVNWIILRNKSCCVSSEWLLKHDLILGRNAVVVRMMEVLTTTTDNYGRDVRGQKISIKNTFIMAGSEYLGCGLNHGIRKSNKETRQHQSWQRKILKRKIKISTIISLYVPPIKSFDI